MSPLNTGLLNVGERALDVASARQRTIANNIANVDTPGYHTRDIDFGNELSRLLERADSSVMEIADRRVVGLTARPDGNDVNIDRESLLLSQTQLQFTTAVQVVRSEFKRLQMAIQEQ